MPVVKVHDKSFETYLSEETILSRIKELAAVINSDYAGKQPFFVAILNGSFMFASDLFKQLDIDAELCFIKLASYKGMKSSGNVVTSIGLDDDLFDKDVIIVEDIVDTGKTLYNFLPRLMHQQPRSLRIATLLHKSVATQYHLTLDYIGFDIPDKFVVGYGLDYDGLGRNFKEIYQLVERRPFSQTNFRMVKNFIAFPGLKAIKFFKVAFCIKPANIKTFIGFFITFAHNRSS